MLLIAGTFIGGLGLFLLAVSMISDGLKLAAGDALRDILDPRLRGERGGYVSLANVRQDFGTRAAIRRSWTARRMFFHTWWCEGSGRVVAVEHNSEFRIKRVGHGGR